MKFDDLPTLAEIRAAPHELGAEESLKKVFKVRDEFTVKYGDSVTLLEADTMRYIADNSSIRIPHVHRSLVDPDTNEKFIMMDFVPGQTLESMLPTLLEEEKGEIAARIQEVMDELRTIPDPGYIGGVGRKPVAHEMFWTPGGPDQQISGPFESEAAFNGGLLRRLTTVPSMAQPFKSLLQKLFAEALKGHRTVFTHGDLQPKNIIVHRTGNKRDGSRSFEVTLIDWEDAGWYPDYWEYCQSNLLPQFRQDWLSMMTKILPTPGYEYTLMRMVFHILYY